MVMTPDHIKATIKAYILNEFLVGENPEALEDSTPLITTGILDSIATVKLIAHLSEQFGVDFEAHEMTVDYLNTVRDIAQTVEAKLAAL